MINETSSRIMHRSTEKIEEKHVESMGQDVTQVSFFQILMICNVLNNFSFNFLFLTECFDICLGESCDRLTHVLESLTVRLPSSLKPDTPSGPQNSYLWSAPDLQSCAWSMLDPTPLSNPALCKDHLYIGYRGSSRAASHRVPLLHLPTARIRTIVLPTGSCPPTVLVSMTAISSTKVK